MQDRKGPFNVLTTFYHSFCTIISHLQIEIAPSEPSGESKLSGCKQKVNKYLKATVS
jgi:hypothetical protein